MRTSLAAALAMILMSAPTVGAHRLDEYLQAATIAVEKGRVAVSLGLTPGVVVFPTVFAEIDTNGDGRLSRAEQRAYAKRVVRDLELSVDGKRLHLGLVSSTFAGTETLREGHGEIRLGLAADVPAGRTDRTLTFENRHHSRIGAYLVNAVVSRDPDIRLGTQSRNYEQSSYQLDYDEPAAPSRLLSLASGLGPWAWLCGAAVGLIAVLGLRGRRAADANGTGCCW